MAVNEGEAEVEQQLLTVTNPYVLLLGIRHLSYLRVGREDRIKLRRAVWLHLEGLNGQPNAPPSPAQFNDLYAHFLAMPQPNPLPQHVNAASMHLLTELVFDQATVCHDVSSIEAGWSNTTFTKLDNSGERSAKKYRGSTTTTAKNFIRGCRRLTTIMHIFKICGTRFIRANTALQIFNPPKFPGVNQHADNKSFLRDLHKVTPQEMWESVEGGGPHLDKRIATWTAKFPPEAGGESIYFFQVE